LFTYVNTKSAIGYMNLAGCFKQERMHQNIWDKCSSSEVWNNGVALLQKITWCTYNWSC